MGVADFKNIINKYLDLDFKKSQRIYLLYYGLGLILLLLPAFRIDYYGLKESINGFQATFSFFGLGILYLLMILCGLVVSLLRSLTPFRKLLFIFAPLLALVGLLMMNLSVSSASQQLMKPIMGFWLMIILQLAAIIWKWLPQLRKVLDKK